MSRPTAAVLVAVPGTELPVLEIPVTRTLIIAGAITSRDFEPVHHDHVTAQERGSADLFMNILTSNGLIGRFVTDWTGPGARLRRVDIRLGVPAYPGDTLRLTGTVVAPADRAGASPNDGVTGDGSSDGTVRTGSPAGPVDPGSPAGTDGLESTRSVDGPHGLASTSGTGSPGDIAGTGGPGGSGGPGGVHDAGGVDGTDSAGNPGSPVGTGRPGGSGSPGGVRDAGGVDGTGSPGGAVGPGGVVGSGSAGAVVAPADGGGVSGEAGPVVVTVAVRATNGRGDHAWGTVEVEVDARVERP